MPDYYYYQYSVIADIAGQSVDIGQLDQTVRSDATVGSDFVGISKLSDQLVAIFTSELTVGEKTHLDGLVDIHVPTPETGTSFIYAREASAHITLNSLKQKNNYHDIANYIYLGSLNDYVVKRVQCYLTVEGDITSLGLRILNLNTGDIVAENSNFAVSASNLYTLDNITNLPTSEGVLEIQLRKNDGKGRHYICVKSVVLYFGEGGSMPP